MRITFDRWLECVFKWNDFHSCLSLPMLSARFIFSVVKRRAESFPKKSITGQSPSVVFWAIWQWSSGLENGCISPHSVTVGLVFRPFTTASHSRWLRNPCRTARNVVASIRVRERNFIAKRITLELVAVHERSVKLHQFCRSRIDEGTENKHEHEAIHFLIRDFTKMEWPVVTFIVNADKLFPRNCSKVTYHLHPV